MKNDGRDERMENPGEAEGLESPGTAKCLEAHGVARVMTDQGRVGRMRGPRGMTSHGEARIYSGANGLKRQGRVIGSEI